MCKVEEDDLSNCGIRTCLFETSSGLQDIDGTLILGKKPR